MSFRAALLRPAKVAAVIAVSVLARPQWVLACAVCYGDPASPQTKGMNMAILFLLAVVGLMLASFAATFSYWMMRSRRISKITDDGVSL